MASFEGYVILFVALLMSLALLYTRTHKSNPSAATKSVVGTLQYLSGAQNSAARYQASEAGTAVEAVHDGDYEYRQVRISNAFDAINRGNHFELDRQGFKCISHTSQVQDFYNDEMLPNCYDSELQKLLLGQRPGARRIVIFDHTRRSSCADTRTTRQSREPSSAIHNDYTEKSAQTRLKDLLHDETLNGGRRFAIVNVWRPIIRASAAVKHVESWPMTFCDSTTIDVDRDIVAVPRVSKNRIGEIQMARYHADHAWYYYPRMTQNQVLLFKTFDSIVDGTNRFTIHTAFDAPLDAGANRPRQPRESIESRAFILY